MQEIYTQLKVLWWGELELSTGDLARAIPPTPSLDVAPSDHLGD